MLLGSMFKRVALWNRSREVKSMLQRITELREMEVSNPELPLAIAAFWRDVSASAFTDLPMDQQICFPLERNHDNLEGIANLLDKALRLIVEDDYEHLTSYLSRKLADKHSDPVAAYLTDKDGFPLDAEAVYLRISTLLYSLAAVLDGMESYEYHRVINPVFRELINVIARLLEIKQR
ncbi:hypothetical protein D3C81_434010 [compost metagenome]